MVCRLTSALAASAMIAFAAGRGCVGSLGVATFRLTVQPPTSNPRWVAMRDVNNIPSGYRIRYQPVDLPSNLARDGRLTLVMVPKTSDGQLTVLEPKPAISSTEWSAPFAAGIVLLVFAPQGLDEKRLTNLVTRDDNLVAALADYADQTADLEAGLRLANDLEQQEEEDAAHPQRPLTPTEQAVFALVRALNPAVSSYDPFGTGRRMGPATLTGKGVNGFFENAGGLFPGSGALAMVKQWLLPDTEFRSVYGIEQGGDAMTLCAQLGPRTRNRLAYIWAYRLTNASAPSAAVAGDVHEPIGMRAAVPVQLAQGADWRLLDKVLDWTLVPERGSTPPLHPAVRPAADNRTLRIDLRGFAGPAGPYRIEGKWDWSEFKLTGVVNLHRLQDLKTARLAPESQDRLVTATGPVDLDVTGVDALFVDHAFLHRPESAHQIPVDLPAARTEDRLRVELDTDGLRPGPYLLALSRIDGATADVPVRVLPSNPRLDQTPVGVHSGDREQMVNLTGSGLDRIQSLECDQADVLLGSAASGGARRGLTVRLRATSKPGDSLALVARVEGLSAPLRFAGALQVTAPRPRIVEAKPSLPADLPLLPRGGEIPAGFFVNFAITIDPPGTPGAVTLECAEPALTVQTEKLRVGERHSNAQLLSAGGGALFLSLDPGSVGQSGCTLTVAVETGSLGKSDPFTLGKVVRLPRIESLTLTDEKSGEGYAGTLKGFDLETIEKTGWDLRTGLNVTELPRPLAGEGAKQSLRIVMPWPSPSPKSPLYVWLRGETEGRATKVSP